MKLIHSNTCVLLTGSSGSGKSFIMHNAALELQKKGYDIHIARTPRQIDEEKHPDKNQVFVMDDVFGKSTIDREDVEKWLNYIGILKGILQVDDITGKSTKHIKQMKPCNFFKVPWDSSKKKPELRNSQIKKAGKTIVLLTCRLTIYKHQLLSRITNELNVQVCNLCSESLFLNLSEKQDMFDRYVGDNVLFENLKSEIESDMDYFPLICLLSLGQDKEIVRDMFKNPPKHIQTDIENMQHAADRLQFYCICICVMFDQGFNLNCLRCWTNSYHANQKSLLITLCGALDFNLNSEVKRVELLRSFDTMLGTYCKRMGDLVVIIHDKVYDIAAKVCGETLLETYMTHASPNFISKRYALADSNQFSKNEYLIKIQKSHEEHCFRRIFVDLSNHAIQSFAFNDQLENEIFQQKLMQYIQKHKKDKMIKSFLDNNTQKIVQSLADCKDEFKTYSEFLFKFGLNKYNVLFAVCANGNTVALECLIKMGVNVNADSHNCSNYTVVTQRVDNEDDDEDCDSDGTTDDDSDDDEEDDEEDDDDDTEDDTEDDEDDVDTENDSDDDDDDDDNSDDSDTEDGNEDDNGDNDDDDDNENQVYTYDKVYAYCKTPLHMAVYASKTGCVKLLLEQKANSLVTNIYGDTPLFVAVRSSNTELVELLIKHTECLSKGNKKGWSPLQKAVCLGKAENVRLLLDHGADPNVCDVQLDTPLHWGARSSKTDCIKLLLEHRADPNVCNDKLDTPLHWGALSGKIGCVKLLLDYGADLTICNKRGNTPLNEAKNKSDNTEVVQMLQRKMDENNANGNIINLRTLSLKCDD